MMTELSSTKERGQAMTHWDTIIKLTFNLPLIPDVMVCMHWNRDLRKSGLWNGCLDFGKIIYFEIFHVISNRFGCQSCCRLIILVLTLPYKYTFNETERMVWISQYSSDN